MSYKSLINKADLIPFEFSDCSTRVFKYFLIKSRTKSQRLQSYKVFFLVFLAALCENKIFWIQSG